MNGEVKLDRATLGELRRMNAALERIAAALEKANADNAQYQGRVVVTGTINPVVGTVKE
jgi:hypothetical protein